MKSLRSLLALSLLPGLALAQSALTTTPSGGNKKASVTEQVGLTTVTLHYDRPGVRGREGKIWNTDVAHYGFIKQDFGPGNPAPWRAGANQNTTITFSRDVAVEGKPLAAGTYGLFMALGADETDVIFSKNTTSWGSYFYNPAEDVLRVKVKNQSLNESIERLRFDFRDQTDSSAAVALEWEKRRIPFRVSTDLVGHQLAQFTNELRDSPGFTWRAFVEAANYGARVKRDLPQALAWADYGLNAPFIGEKNFQTLTAKANVLNAMSRPAEAEPLVKEALPLGTLNELYQYGRQLLSAKQAAPAYVVFKAAHDRFPNQFLSNVGMGQGLTATGKGKEAATYLKAAIAQAPDASSRTAVETLLKQAEGSQNKL